MTEAQIVKLVASLIAGNTSNTKRKQAKKPVEKADRVAAYEQSVMRGFNAKGIKNADLELRVNVLPYKVWIEKGRCVRKGEHGVRGLFHITQTDVLATPVSA